MRKKIKIGKVRLFFGDKIISFEGNSMGEIIEVENISLWSRVKINEVQKKCDSGCKDVASINIPINKIPILIKALKKCEQLQNKKHQKWEKSKWK